MPKCVACNGYATHTAKGFDMCKKHAELIPLHERVLPDKTIPHCVECKKPLDVVDWNTSRFVFVCTNSGCHKTNEKQRGEYKKGGLSILPNILHPSSTPVNPTL